MRIPFFGNKKEVVVEKKSGTEEYNISPDSFLAAAFGRSGWITASQAMSLYRNTSAIATAVDMIASAVKQINPVIQTQDGTYITDHPVLDLLKKPNGFDDWMSFSQTVVTDYLLKHDSIILASGNIKHDPIELWPVSLQKMSVSQAEDDYPGSYMVSSGVMKGNYIRTKTKNRELRFYDGRLKELYHIKGFMSRVVKIESDSPLQAAAMEAKQLIKGKYHNVKLLENGARLSLLVTFNDDDEINQDEHDRRKQRLNEQYAGNAGTIGVISGADVQNIKEFGKTNKDMDFANLDKMASYAIYLRYQIPLSLVSQEASTFDNLKTGIELLYDNAVLPNAKVVFSGLSRMLLPRFGMDPTKEKITFIPESIEPLKQRLLEEINKRGKNAIETTNELRSLMTDRNDIEGGNILYIKNNMMSINPADQPEEPEPDNPKEDENEEA